MFILMERISSYGSLPLIFTYLTCFQILVYQASLSLASSCLDSERHALTKFREGLNDPLRCLSSWDAPNCCKWRGITCDNTTGYVVKLNLRNPYPLDNFGQPVHDFWNLSGRLDPALSRLKHLKHLDLSGNNFYGIPFPEFFSSFKELRYLDLSYVPFTGRIPDQLGNLSNIVYMDLSSTFLYARNLKWLANMSSLKYLNLTYVGLWEVRDNWVHVINEIPSLVELRMFQCGLSDIAQTLAYNNLTSLRVLDLAANEFNSSIPNWIVNITSLTSLNLSFCSFHGPVPYSFSELPELKDLNLRANVDLSADYSKLLGGSWSSIQTIDMSINQVYGEIPVSIGNITTLVYLDLSKNPLTGSLPDGIGRLQNLKYLSLCDCKLTGSIPPSVGRLSSLESLFLDGNQLNGSIPTTLGQLSKLKYFSLSHNSLVGTVTELHFEKLTDLKILDMSFNHLVFDVRPDWVPLFQANEIYLRSCFLGPLFPAWLRTQKSDLTFLDISNTSISDTMPSWFWDLTLQLHILNLSNNRIEGQLPSMLKMNFSLAMDLSSNLFRGPIPSDITRVSYFFASKNQITGPIPTSIGKDCDFNVLDLSHNKLYGQIPPSLGDNCGFLQTLDLSSNLLFGSIPSSLGLLSSIQTLKLSNNHLSGELPLSLRNCSSLEVIDMGENNLSGNIPAWIGESFPVLTILSLRFNLFIGEIPPQLSYLTSLQVIDLSHNLLFGPIPRSFGNFVAMQSKQKARMNHGCGNILVGGLLYYEQSLVLTMKGMQLEYSKTLSLVTCMDLSHNSLSGEIHENLTLLLGLRALNLSGNNLSGEIPSEIDRLVLLESVDLSRNRLHGEIPQSMSTLTFLSYLNLSNNNFTGRIPSGPQLQTLNDPSIYSANPLLCGDPLPKQCEEDETPQSPGEEDDNDWIEIQWFCIGMAPGYVFGIWAVLGILILKKSWRICLFHFIDEVKESLLCAW